ncbi:MAG TPA: rod shape-determining protein MreC [Armatimonadota bacterium]|jgi:rod shape-determining protein MreC|nr:rod shape-determining protein MreC [Armatimonadota bacterium]HOM81601.1 rod shape-determining protein MreC [Armatimonadota bacterium]HOQ29056.1 rod shape-determining protein MreC [Armatimonadota bacterium]HPO71178.1 rod shape-determining protein MreC [Armatimonadota bacterium]
MFPRVDRNLVRLLLALLIVVLLAAGHRRATSAGEESLGATIVAVTLSPFQRTLVSSARMLENAWGIVREIRTLYAENQRLRARVEQLEQRVNILNERALENQRLREMLRFRETLPRSGENALAATVIGVKPTNAFNTITVDRGANDGVQAQQMVLTPRGLVGQVRVVTPNTATVLLITDLTSGVGGRVQRTGWRGVVRGTAGPLLEMTYIPKEADVRRGDLVVTSGVGSIFQVKGIVIGKVENVRLDENISVKTATVRPAVDFRRLEEVLVLTQ